MIFFEDNPLSRNLIFFLEDWMMELDVGIII